MKHFFILLALLYFSGDIIAQHNSYKEDEVHLRNIYDEALMNGDAYENLRYLCKEIGGRLSGSRQLDNAILWSKQLMEMYHFDTVWLQPVMIPNWERGAQPEYAEIIHSDGRRIPIAVTALGFSIATPLEGITAKVREVVSLEEVAAMKSDELKNTIVFYNRPMDAKLINTFHAYGGCVDQRSGGASESAPKGAVASIVRSMGLREDHHPHTGVQRYKTGVKKIPATAISTFDANYLSKALKEDPELMIHLEMSCKTYEDVLSYNVIGEIRGNKYSDELILVSGHLDSWDTGEGAHDDGSGVVQSIEVLRLIQKTGYQPQRTIRCVLWTNEENGAMGAEEYAKQSKLKKWKHLAAIESDRGGFTPRGFTIDGLDGTKESGLLALQKWADLLAPYDLHKFEYGFSGVDINKLKDQDVVLIGFVPDSQRYFDHHHTSIDNFEAVNKRELELGAASMAALVFLIDKYGFSYTSLKGTD